MMRFVFLAILVSWCSVVLSQDIGPTFSGVGAPPAAEKKVRLRAVIFTARWCVPCKIYEADILKSLPPAGWRIGGEAGDLVPIDVDSGDKMLKWYDRGGADHLVPQVVVLRGDRVVGRFYGKHPASKLGDFLNSCGEWR